MIDESDWSCQDVGVDTTSGTQLYQTIPWMEEGLARESITTTDELQTY